MEIEVGSILNGKVTGITKFGAFVSLPGGRSGLVHISEIAYSYVSDISEHLAEGDQVKVKVIEIDANNRINLSIKQALPPPPKKTERRGSTGQANAGTSAGRKQEAYSSKQSQTKTPTSFEDQLKQFMAASDSKLSEHHMNEKRGNRRSRHK